MKLTPEARHWYRSAMVWFLGFAGLMEIVGQALPEVQGHLPDGWYDHVQVTCVAVGALARFIQQSSMRKAVLRKGGGNV